MSSDPTADAEKANRAEAKRTRKAQAARGQDDGWTATGTLLAGIVVWGGIGWLLSLWTDWIGFLPIGVILGAALGVYLVVKQAGDPPPLLDISKGQKRSRFVSEATKRKQGLPDE